MAGLPTFGQIMSDSTAQVIAYWDKGEKQNYSVTHEKIKIKDSDTISKVITTYEVEITVLDSTAHSYTIEWLYKNLQNKGENPLMQKILSATNDLKVIFKTDENGEFVELLNWEEIKDYIQKTTALLRKEYKDLPEVDKVVDQLEATLSTKEAIEFTSIKDIQQYHSFHGGQYTLGKLVEATRKVPNVLGTEPFDAIISVSLDEINEEDNNFILRVSQEIDKEQLTEATFNYLVTMAKNLQADPPKPEDIKGLKNEILTSSRIHGTGWVLYSVQTSTVILDDMKNIEERIIEIK